MLTIILSIAGGVVIGAVLMYAFFSWVLWGVFRR